jgi:hypothetical protein
MSSSGRAYFSWLLVNVYYLTASISEISANIIRLSEGNNSNFSVPIILLMF